MIEVTSYLQPQYFGGPTQRVFTPAPLTPAAPSSSTPDLLREMAFNASNYYSSSNPTKQPVEARSASVSSVSSSTSHSSPPSMQHGTISRTISPVPSMTDSGISNALVSGSHYQQPSQHQSYTPQTHTTSLLPSPSQYFQAQMAPPVPLYSSLPQRQHSQSPHYSYQISSIPSQPPPLSMQSFHPLGYTQFASSSYHSPPSALQSYQASPLLHYRTEVRATSAFLKRLQSLPPHIIDKIHNSFTYLECWQLYTVSRWFRDNFNPANLPDEDKIAGVRYAEQYYRRYFPGRASSSNAHGNGREYDSRHPGSFGCYHCFRIKGPEHFEQFKWNNHPEDEVGSEAGSSTTASRPGAASTRSTSPRPSTTTSYSSTGNSHYDPSLTRSSVTAAANNSRRASWADSAGSPASSSATPGGSMLSTDSPRIKETWGIRRFCIDCGINKSYYRPGDLIELCKSKEAVWVCKCWKIHWRPAEIKCNDCGSFIPLSTPSRRRG